MRHNVTQVEILLSVFAAMVLPGIPHEGNLAQFPIVLATPPAIQLLQVGVVLPLGFLDGIV